MNNSKIINDGRDWLVADMRHHRLTPEAFLPMASDENIAKWKLLNQIKRGWEKLDADQILSVLTDDFVFSADRETGIRLARKGFQDYLPWIFDNIKAAKVIPSVDLVVIYESLFECFPYALQVVLGNTASVLTFGFNDGKVSMLNMMDPEIFTYEPTFAKGGIVQEEGMPRVFGHECADPDRGRRMTEREIQQFAVKTVATLFREANANVWETNEGSSAVVPYIVTKCGSDIYYHYVRVSTFRLDTNAYKEIDNSEDKINEFVFRAKLHGARPMFMSVSFVDMNNTKSEDVFCGSAFIFRVEEAQALI